MKVTSRLYKTIRKRLSTYELRCDRIYAKMSDAEIIDQISQLNYRRSLYYLQSVIDDVPDFIQLQEDYLDFSSFLTSYLREIETWVYAVRYPIRSDRSQKYDTCRRTYTRLKAKIWSDIVKYALFTYMKLPHEGVRIPPLDSVLTVC